MAGELRTSLQIGYVCPDPVEERQSLALENVAQLRQGKNGSIDIFRLYPPVKAEYFTSTGALVDEDLVRDDFIVELVRFSGSKRARLKYPRNWSRSAPWWQGQLPTSGCGGEDVGGFDSSGVSREVIQAYDANGSEVRPHIAYDGDTNELVADEAINGLVRASYTAKYKRAFLYRNGDQILRSGNVVAFYRGISSEAGFGSVTPEQPITVYSVVSEYVADEQGAWEVPPNWDEDNTYPIRQDEPLPNQDSYQQLERVHENCFLDQDGTMRYEKYTVRWEQPYDTPGVSYQPKYKFDRGDAPAQDSPWWEPWTQINWASIQADVTARYPGITGF